MLRRQLAVRIRPALRLCRQSAARPVFPVRFAKYGRFRRKTFLRSHFHFARSGIGTNGPAEKQCPWPPVGISNIPFVPAIGFSGMEFFPNGQHTSGRVCPIFRENGPTSPSSGKPVCPISGSNGPSFGMDCPTSHVSIQHKKSFV